MSDNKLPSYEELFGNLDYQNADEYRSVLSPAAYLADIMDLKNWRYDEGDKKRKDAVDDRREDISEILLNKENTITEIPHLDIVNRVMENRLAIIAGETNSEDAYDTLKAALFPFNLPFNKAKIEIKHLLGYLKSSPLQFYKQFTAAPDIDVEARESLDLSREEYGALITPITDQETLLLQYGADKGSTIDDLSSLKRFRKATELSAIQVLELLYQNLSFDERDNGVSSRFFINSQEKYGAYLVIKTEEGGEEEQLYLRSASGDSIDDSLPPLDYWDRINRFIRTSRKTGLSFADLDLILMHGCDGKLDNNAMQVIAVVKWLQNNYELPVEKICTLFAGIKDYGKGEHVLPDDLFNRTFNNGRDRTIAALSDLELDDELNNRLRAGLGCTESEFNTIASYLNGAGKIMIPDPARLALPYRIKMLSEAFEVPVSSLLSLFQLIDRNYQLLAKEKFPLPIGFRQTIDNTRAIITLEGTDDSETISNTKNSLWLVQLSAVLMQWLNDHDMTVEQLAFICTEHSMESVEVEDIPGNQEITDLFRELAEQLNTELFTPPLMVSSATDQTTAVALFEQLTDIETGFLTSRGLVTGLATAEELLPAYEEVIREKLFIEVEDLSKTGLSDEERVDLILLLQSQGFIDLDHYVTSDEDRINHFGSPPDLETFLVGIDRSIASIVFKELSSRVNSYTIARDTAAAECAAIAEKINVQAGRQQAALLGALEIALDQRPDILKILLVTLFTTIDETEQMATVRFIEPIMAAVDEEISSGELKFNASLVTSFRRLLRFNLLVTKTGLRARELAVLLHVEDVQDALLEKLKLPAPFNNRIDAIYTNSNSNAEGDVFIFSDDHYIRFSGEDYAFEASGKISELNTAPTEFAAGISAAVGYKAATDVAWQNYLFSGDQFINTRTPDGSIFQF